MIISSVEGWLRFLCVEQAFVCGDRVRQIYAAQQVADQHHSVSFRFFKIVPNTPHALLLLFFFVFFSFSLNCQLLPRFCWNIDAAVIFFFFFGYATCGRRQAARSFSMSLVDFVS